MSRRIRGKLSTPKAKLLASIAPIAIAAASVGYSVACHDVNFVGAVGGAASSFMYAPQAYKSFKTKSTGDISLTTLALGIGSSAVWITYGAMIGAVPLWGATAAIMGLTSVTAGVKVNEVIKNGDNIRKTFAAAIVPLAVSIGTIGYAVSASQPGVAGAEAAVASSIMFIPQAYKSFKTRSTGDISIGSLSMNFGVTVAWMSYGFMIHSPAVWGSEIAGLAQNSVTGTIKVSETLKEIRRGDATAAGSNENTIHVE